MPIISISEGKELGTVKELLINHTNGTVAALVVDDSKWYLGAKLLPFAAVTGLGEYAVTVESSNDILSVSAQPEFEKFLDAGIKVIGTKVLTKNGRIQGKVIELNIDETGAIASVEVEKVNDEVVEIAAQSIVTFGKEVLIMTEGEEAPAPVRPAVAAPAEPVVAVAAEPAAVVEPAVVATVEPAAAVQDTVAESTETPVPAEDSAKKFDEKQRKYLLGKKVNRRIETDNGLVIVEQDAEITEEVLQKAKLAGKFVELSMSIQ